MKLISSPPNPAATRRVCIVTNCVSFFSPPFPFPLLLPLHVRNSLRLLGGILHFFRTPAASHCLEINFSTKYSLLFPLSLCGYFCCVLSFMLLRIFMVSLMFIFSAAAYIVEYFRVFYMPHDMFEACWTTEIDRKIYTLLLS